MIRYGTGKNVPGAGVDACTGKAARGAGSGWCKASAPPLAGGALARADLALRFVLEHPVSTVIPGMDKVEQVDENAGIGDEMRPLSSSEREVLEEEA